MEEELSPIRKFYNGKVIFITGATGFVGQTLLEKLLRECPEISRIYILLREKKRITINERMRKLFDNDIFNTIKEKQPLFQDKLTPIFGDIDSPNLGLRPSDIEILKQSVNIVFHSAARVRFDDALRFHVRSNIVATKELIRIVKTFKHIQAFIYISTQFCVYDEPDIVIEEKIMKKRISPTELICVSKWMDDNAIRTLFPKLVDREFLPYLFTKGVVENAIEEDHDSLPVVIIRPSLVMSAYKEPFPGWCDVSQGFQAIAILILKGIFRAILIERRTRMKIVPIDIVINAMITAAWYITLGKLPPKDILVLNLSMDEDKNSISDVNMYRMMGKYFKKYPLSNIIRCPSFSIYRNKYLFEIHNFFDHYIPALLADMITYLCTGKRMMFKVYQKMITMPRVRNSVSYPKRTYKMNNKKTIENALSPLDSKKFFLSLPENFSIEEYIENFVLGVRKCGGKENLLNVEYARQKAKIWWFVTSTLKWSAIYGVCHMIGITKYKIVFYSFFLKFIHLIIAAVF